MRYDGDHIDEPFELCRPLPEGHTWELMGEQHWGVAYRCTDPDCGAVILPYLYARDGAPN